MNMTQTRLYSSQTHKNRIRLVSYSCVVSNFVNPSVTGLVGGNTRIQVGKNFFFFKLSLN